MKIFDYNILDGPLVKCRNCGLVYVDTFKKNFLIENGESSIRREKAFLRESKSAREKLKIKDEVERSEQEVKKNSFRDRVKEICKYRSSGTLLEIGCSTGLFLNEARKFGYKVYGIEPHRANSEYARNVLGLDIFTGTLHEAQLKDGCYDITVMLHTIEHFPDPSAEILEIRKKLKPHGLLVIETPNISNIWYKLFGKKWRQFIPGHYYFFSPDTIQKLLKKFNFGILKTISVGKTVSIHFFLNRAERLIGEPAKILSSLTEILGLNDKLIYINPGDVMLVIAEKR